MNYLERFVAEWYEYQGYFVRRNVNVGRRPRGGWECELDVVAFHPEKKHLVHIEPSMDANSWDERERRYTKKFAAGRKYIPALFAGLELPGQVEQIALFEFASKANRTELAGGKIMLVSELLQEVVAVVRDRRVASAAISEQYPILRTVQFMCQYNHVMASGA
ncbi:MAG: hypothetical protein OHK0048_24430 [Rhodoferax sp.]